MLLSEINRWLGCIKNYIFNQCFVSLQLAHYTLQRVMLLLGKQIEDIN